ncbi:hypothetical protein [Shewanella sp. YIC-542]|uniref:hypothetical protein n=1 Tax=Shewanella mytili TaxID=3377111 RepID=UPI00398E4B18
MLFIETEFFTCQVKELMPDDMYRELQQYLADNPEAGPVIQGTGGLRKLRWQMPGRGKRGGVRVIYYHVELLSHIRLLMMYPKNEQEDLTAEQKKLLRAIVERW